MDYFSGREQIVFLGTPGITAARCLLSENREFLRKYFSESYMDEELMKIYEEENFFASEDEKAMKALPEPDDKALPEPDDKALTDMIRPDDKDKTYGSKHGQAERLFRESVERSIKREEIRDLEKMTLSKTSGMLMKIDRIMPGYKDEYGLKAIRCVSRGGVLKALWDIGRNDGNKSEDVSGNILKNKSEGHPGSCSGKSLGLSLYLRDIPIKQCVTELCENMSLNPYMLWSENACIFLMERGDQFVRDLFLKEQLILKEKKGFDSEHRRIRNPFSAAVIGKVNHTGRRVYLDFAQESFLTKGVTDPFEEMLLRHI